MTEHELREQLVLRMRRGLRLPDAASHLNVSPLVLEAFVNGAQMTDAAMALLPKILDSQNGHARAQPPPATKSRPMGTHLTAKALKCTLPLDPTELAALGDPKTPRVTLRIAVGGRVVTADVNAKAVRKAKVTIAAHGAANVIAFVQGRLESGDVIAEAGLTAQVKLPNSNSNN